MAVIFMDGFDSYAKADLSKRWTAYPAGCAIGPAYARSKGGQGFWDNDYYGNALAKSFGANYVEGIVGFAYMPVGGNAAGKMLLQIMDGGSEQISIRFDGSSRASVSRNGTTIGSGVSAPAAADTWHYYELKFAIDGSAGSFDLRVDGVSVCSGSGLSTQSTGNTRWTGFQFHNYISQGQLDDVYAMDTSTGSNEFLGPVKIVALAPAAAGHYAQWTPLAPSNLEAVAEMLNDGDASVNQSGTAGQIDTFAMADLTALSGTVFAVQHVLVARQDAGTQRVIAPVQRSGSTDYVGSNRNLSTSYQVLTEIHELNPATSSAFTIADVNDLEAGYTLIA